MRGRGGFFGFNRVPAASAINSAASGVWNLREAESLRRAGTWPIPPSPVLLMHFNAENGSTAFIDSTATNTATAIGSVSISTSASKFGGSSAFFNGGHIGFASTAATQFGTADFSIDFWLYPTSYPQDNQVVLSMVSWPNQSGIQLSISSNSFTATTGGFGQYRVIDGTFVNKWTHFAISRISGSLAIYVNGIAQSFSGTRGNMDGDYSDGLQYIGRPTDVNNYKFFGYMDELRIVRGTSMFTANFTPPSSEY